MHLGFSKQDLLKAWHKAAREVSPADLTWEGRDHLQAQCTLILVREERGVRVER